MGRPREFDTDTALQGAMEIFWRQGFKATNLPELLEAMGLTRGSFYKAFGDKESVYLLALQRYDDQIVSRTVDALQASRAPNAAACLSMLFAGKGGTSRGCFICNAMVELGPDSAEVAKRANEMADRLRGAIAGVVLRYGAARSEAEAAEQADTVLHLYFGHQALGKAGQGPRDWEGRLEELLG